MGDDIFLIVAKGPHHDLPDLFKNRSDNKSNTPQLCYVIPGTLETGQYPFFHIDFCINNLMSAQK